MCGIVGIVGCAPVADRIVNSLKRLEYRGYDSTGLAVVNDNQVALRKVVGKIANLENKIKILLQIRGIEERTRSIICKA